MKNSIAQPGFSVPVPHAEMNDWISPMTSTFSSFWRTISARWATDIQTSNSTNSALLFFAWVSAVGLSNNNKWRWWLQTTAAYRRTRTAQVRWLGLRVDSRLCAALHSSKWTEWTLAMTFSGHDDSTINIVLGLLLLLLLLFDQQCAALCTYSQYIVAIDVVIARQHVQHAECDIVSPFCPPVHPSVRPCRCCDLSSRFRSLGRGIIVFEPKFKGERHFAGSLNTRVWKICYFRPKLPFISETVRDSLCLLYVDH